MSQRPRSTSSARKRSEAITCRRVRPDVAHRSFASPSEFSHCTTVATSPALAASTRSFVNTNTIFDLASLILMWIRRSASLSPYERRPRREGKGDSENIDFREFPALFRARASRGRRWPNAVKPVLSRAPTPSTRTATTATTTYSPTASRNRRRSSLSVSSWSNAPRTPMSTSTITKIRTIKQQYRFRISF